MEHVAAQRYEKDKHDRKQEKPKPTLMEYMTSPAPMETLAVKSMQNFSSVTAWNKTDTDCTWRPNMSTTICFI